MIKSLSIKNFLGFRELEAEKLTPVNIIIGPDGSGKAGLLKMLYGVAKSLENFQEGQRSIAVAYKKVLADKLFNTFQPRKSGLGELVNRNDTKKLAVNLTFKNKQNIQFSFGESTTNSIVDCTENAQIDNKAEFYNALFVPSKEVLTAFDAIALTRERFNMPGFDDTYYDLILDLRVPVQQGKFIHELTKVNTELEDLFDGIIVQGPKENPFIFKKGKSEFGMPLTAEGIKKIGILTTLIKNRRLKKNTILFMDEPETALHAKAVRSLAEMIVMMSKAGVQIFITSHNYFLIKQLAIIARRDNTDINCFSLDKERNKSVKYSVRNLKDGVPDNPIIQEAITMFNEEIKLDLGV